jgi:hypothetical protein
VLTLGLQARCKNEEWVSGFHRGQRLAAIKAGYKTATFLLWHCSNYLAKGRRPYNVNAYHRRFRQWLARFNGVASRYLPNYLGWQWAVDGRRIPSAEGMLRIALSPSNAQR